MNKEGEIKMENYLELYSERPKWVMPVSLMALVTSITTWFSTLSMKADQFFTEMTGAYTFAQMHWQSKLPVPQMDVVDNINSSFGKLLKRLQILIPIIAALLLLFCFGMYAFSDQYSQKAKSWGLKILFSAAGAWSVVSIVKWVQDNMKW